MNETTTQIMSAQPEAQQQYEPPSITDFGTLAELTAGNKSSSAPDQLIGAIPAAFS
jgi:hypothetical protein